MAKKKEMKDGLTVKGFYRLNIINPDGSVASDTGYRPNQIVNNGYQNFLMYLLAGSAGSLRPSHAAIGTGTAPGSAATTLPGEATEALARASLTTGTSGSKTVSYTFTINSGVITGGASTIQNVGLFSGSTTGGGTLMAGASYTTSSLATNQAVNGTYQIIFG